MYNNVYAHKKNNNNIKLKTVEIYIPIAKIHNEIRMQLKEMK